MAKIKGSGKEMTERVFKRHHPKKYQQFLASFTPAQRAVYNHTIAVRWEEIETDEEENVLRRAANILYPNDPKALFRYGHESAVYGFSFIYRIFFRLPSLTNLFKKLVPNGRK